MLEPTLLVVVAVRALWAYPHLSIVLLEAMVE
jgi:hypothetical protein